MVALLSLVSMLWSALLSGLTWIVKTFGIASLVVVGMYFYYEGVPLVKSVPLVGWLAEGRVQHASEAAATAARSGLVSASEKASLEAQVWALDHQLQVANSVTETYRNSADNARKVAEDAKAKLDAKIAADSAADSADDGAPRWTQSDLDWLSKH